MTEHSQPKSKNINLVGPMLLIGFGIILLLNNTGQLNFSVWSLLRLWPLFIISAGLEVLFGKRSLLGSFIAALLILLLFVGGVWMLNNSPASQVSPNTLYITEARNDINAARVQLFPAVAQLNVSHLRDSSNLVEGVINPGDNETIFHRFIAGDPARLLVETENGGVTRQVFNGNPRTWDLKFHRDVALKFTADLGVGEANLDLAYLTLDDVNVDFGVGQLTLSLPAEGEYTVHIDGGVGAIRLQVPYGAGVIIRPDTGIVGRNFPSSYTRHDNVYISPHYHETDTRISININLGIGSVSVVEHRGD